MPDQLTEGRHSAPWREEDHPRGYHGRFGHSTGGDSSSGSGRRSSGGSSDGGSASRDSGRGMPDTIASSDIALSKGGTATLNRHADGGLSISDGTRSSKLLTAQQSTKLLNTLAVADDWDPGDDETLPGIGRITRERGGYQLDFDDGPSLKLSGRDVTRMETVHSRLNRSSRVDTGNGDLDIFSDGKKVGFRHLGDDGRPVEVTFNRPSINKIQSTIDQIIDDRDLDDLPADTYTKDVATNVGKVRVTLHGDWAGTNPGDRMSIMPVEGDDWGIVVDGPQQRSWSSAMSDMLSEAESTACNLTEQVSLSEAAGGQTPKGRRFRARIIAGDIQGSSGYYPAKVLQRDAGAFRAGLPVFLDHPGVTEAYERPERSVRDLAGRLASPAVYERDGLYADVEVYPHWAPVIEAMADHIGMSIRASGTVEASTDKTIPGPVVTSITEAASVDFVTQAGAGGKLVSLLESARAHSGDLLRKAAETRTTDQRAAEPAHAEITESSAPTISPAPPVTTHQEGAPMSGSTNPQGTPPDGGAPTALAEADTLRQQLSEAKQQLAEAQLKLAAVGDNSAKLAEAEKGLAEARLENLRLRADNAARDRAAATLAESTLPEVAYPRVIAAVTGENVPLTEAGGLDEAKLTENITKAIERERVYLASFAEAAGLGAVRGLGSTGGDTVNVEDELNAIFKGSAIGMSESSAAVAAKGRA